MSERSVYTLAGVALAVVIELLRWLAKAPPELCTALSGLATFLMAGGPSVLPAPKSPPDQRGHVRVGVALALGLLALFLAFTIPLGCGFRDVVDDGAPVQEIKRGPPCVMTQRTSDWELQGRITSPNHRCRVIIEGTELP